MSRNPYGRSASEQAEYERFIYPDKDEQGLVVLKNKLDIRSNSELEKAERYLASKRLAQGLPAAARDQSYSGLKAIHRHLLQDVYEWAGEERRYTTGRNDASFARPEFIKSMIDAEFAKLHDANCLQELKADEFATRAAAHVIEINAVHPFVDGNGRTTRTWLRELADQAGHEVRLRSEDAVRWNDAAKYGFFKSPDPMATLLIERTTEKSRERLREKSKFERDEKARFRLKSGRSSDDGRGRQPNRKPDRDRGGR